MKEKDNSDLLERYPEHVSYVVTSGKGHLDIDAFACCVGMVDFLRQLGRKSYFVSTSPFNTTVPESLRTYDFAFNSASPENTKYIICDVSEPEFFDSCVIPSDIHEVIDHHFGLESYWENHPHSLSDIRPVAACASLIVERFRQAGLTPNPLSQKLLRTAIVSNSLGLKLRLTCDVDLEAYRFLGGDPQRVGETESWYFKECQSNFFLRPLQNLLLDTKLIPYEGKQLAIGQLEVWEADTQELNKLFDKFKNHWSPIPTMINAAVVGDGNNRIYASQPELVEKMSCVYPGAAVSGNAFQTENLLLLRKELMREILS